MLLLLPGVVAVDDAEDDAASLLLLLLPAAAILLGLDSDSCWCQGAAWWKVKMLAFISIPPFLLYAYQPASAHIDNKLILKTLWLVIIKKIEQSQFSSTILEHILV